MGDERCGLKIGRRQGTVLCLLSGRKETEQGDRRETENRPLSPYEKEALQHEKGYIINTIC